MPKLRGILIMSRFKHFFTWEGEMAATRQQDGKRRTLENPSFRENGQAPVEFHDVGYPSSGG